MDKHLVLGPIPENFDPKLHVPIAPHCFIGREYIYQEWEDLDFVYGAFDSIESQVKADKKTSKEARYWVKVIGKYLNKKFNWNYTYRFWHIILYPWLLHLIQLVWDCQSRLNNFLDINEHEDFKVILLNKETPWKFNDTREFIIDGVINQQFINWIFSVLINSVDRPNIKVVDEVKYIPSNEVDRVTEKSGGIVYKIYNKIPWVSCPISGMGMMENIYLNMIIFSKNLKKYRSKKVDKFKPDYGITDSLLKWEIDIEMLIKNMLPKSIENLPEHMPKFRIPSYYLQVSNRLFYSDQDMKPRAALHKEQGGEIICTQHGGHNYGSGITCELINGLEYESDIFITWGWSSHSDYNVKSLSLPYPYLSRYKNKHDKRNDKIIMVGTKAFLTPFRFDTTHPQNWIEYRKKKVNFIKSIIKNYGEKFYYRPYFNENGALNERAYLLDHFPNLKILETELHQEMMHCNLLVLDHPGTTLNIAMAANVPTLMFWEREHFPFCQKAEKHLERFEDLGIFSSNPQKIGKKIIQIDNLYTWWKSPEIQNAREDFVAEYALADENWFEEWKMAYKKL